MTLSAANKGARFRSLRDAINTGHVFPLNVWCRYQLERALISERTKAGYLSAAAKCLSENKGHLSAPIDDASRLPHTKAALLKRSPAHLPEQRLMALVGAIAGSNPDRCVTSPEFGATAGRTRAERSSGSWFSQPSAWICLFRFGGFDFSRPWPSGFTLPARSASFADSSI